MSSANPWKQSIKELRSIVEDDIYTMVNYVSFDFSAEFTEACLGTVPKDPDIYKSFIASKMQKKETVKVENLEEKMEEETETVDATGPDGERLSKQEAKGWTGFHKDDDGIFIYNYSLLGSIKANIRILNENGAIAKIKAFKKACDLCLVVDPRRIRFYRDKNNILKPDGWEKIDAKTYKMMDAPNCLERSLRASGPHGESVTLVRSDKIEAGTRFDFTIKILKNDMGLTPEALIKALKLAEICGMGQWRGSGGYGTYKINSVKKSK